LVLFKSTKATKRWGLCWRWLPPKPKFASPNGLGPPFLTENFIQVLRDSVVTSVPTTLIVPGDIIVIKDGSVVPADLRLLHTKDLQIDESVLTGENEPVLKSTKVVEKDNCPLGDRTNMAYMSTVVTKGRGVGIIVTTGMKTEIGKIAKELKSNSGFQKTPLQKRHESAPLCHWTTRV